MKTKSILITLISLVVVFTSCSKIGNRISPSSNITTVERTVDSYNKLDVSDAFNVVVTFSEEEESVFVEANDNLHQYIQIDNSNNALRVKMANNITLSGKEAILNIFIKTKNISAFYISGASQLKLDNLLSTDNVEIDLSGASSMRGEIQVDEMRVELSGSSILSLNGESNILDLSFSGASTMNDFDFKTNNLNADLSGASNVSLEVNNKLEVDASGASNVFYKGNGIVYSQSLTGASQIVKLN